MTKRTLTLAVLAALTMTGPAWADERVDVTPTLYREQARATATVRPASELSTTPQPVRIAPARPRFRIEAAATATP